MKILHVVAGLQKASGVTTFVENVVREQRALGHEVAVVTDKEPNHHNFSLLTSHFSLPPQVVHIHGLWMPFLHRVSRYAARHHIPVVLSTHGMTAPWSLHHKWWKKCLPWYLYQRADLRRAALIHCTTDLEETWNRALGFANTFVAPLGTTLPVDATSSSRPQQRTLLYVGRIHPVKALDNLIRAFVSAEKQRRRGGEKWVLRIVGPDQAGHLQELKTLVSSQHPSTSALIEFPGPRYGADLDAEYENCTALALVSHTENFGATAVDALAHSKPVITSTNTPWKIVADKGCGLWVDNAPETLSRAISQLLNLSTSQLSDMGRRGRQLVEESYAWPAIAAKLCVQYDKLLSANDP